MSKKKGTKSSSSTSTRQLLLQILCDILDVVQQSLKLIDVCTRLCRCTSVQIVQFKQRIELHAKRIRVDRLQSRRRHHSVCRRQVEEKLLILCRHYFAIGYSFVVIVQCCVQRQLCRNATKSLFDVIHRADVSVLDNGG
jgi:hypothetical protein